MQTKENKIRGWKWLLYIEPDGPLMREIKEGRSERELYNSAAIQNLGNKSCLSPIVVRESCFCGCDFLVFLQFEAPEPATDEC